MLISVKSTETLKNKLEKESEVFCSGLFLSARWFIVSQLDYSGIQLIVMPDRDSAEYCAADLYNLVEGDSVFFLPDSGKKLEKSKRRLQRKVSRKYNKNKRTGGLPYGSTRIRKVHGA